MSPKYSSLAFDEAVREFDNDIQSPTGFEPDLKVIINAHYAKAPVSNNNVIQIKGAITVSF